MSSHGNFVVAGGRDGAVVVSNNGGKFCIRVDNDVSWLRANISQTFLLNRFQVIISASLTPQFVESTSSERFIIFLNFSFYLPLHFPTSIISTSNFTDFCANIMNDRNVLESCRTCWFDR